MTCGDRGGLHIRERALELAPIRVGQDHVLVRHGRRVAAEHLAGLHGRLKAPQEFKPFSAELLA